MKKTVLISALICLFALPFAFGQAIPDAGFEAWTTHGSGTLTYPVPNGWATIDSFTAQALTVGFVTKDSINPHSGSYCIKLQSKLIPLASTVVPAAACSGIIHLVSPSPLTYNVLGGFPVSAKPNFLSGWYRDSLPGTGDSSIIVAIFTKWDVALQKRDTVAFGGMVNGTNQLTWTQFNFQIYDDSISPVTPDTGIVVLYSGKATGAVAGTTMWVDDISFVTGINEIDVLNSNYDLYPNPVAGTLYIQNNNFLKKDGYITIYDEMGKKVSTSYLNDNLSTVNTKSLPQGIYFYEITNTNNSIVKKGKFIINN